MIGRLSTMIETGKERQKEMEEKRLQAQQEEQDAATLTPEQENEIRKLAQGMIEYYTTQDFSEPYAIAAYEDIDTDHILYVLTHDDDMPDNETTAKLAKKINYLISDGNLSTEETTQSQYSNQPRSIGSCAHGEQEEQITREMLQRCGIEGDPTPAQTRAAARIFEKEGYTVNHPEEMQKNGYFLAYYVTGNCTFALLPELSDIIEKHFYTPQP